VSNLDTKLSNKIKKIKEIKKMNNNMNKEVLEIIKKLTYIKERNYIDWGTINPEFVYTNLSTVDNYWKINVKIAYFYEEISMEEFFYYYKGYIVVNLMNTINDAKFSFVLFTEKEESKEAKKIYDELKTVTNNEFFKQNFLKGRQFITVPK
jgi:hypothetical protein